MIVPVIWKSYNPESPARGYWDQGMVEDLLNNKMWTPYSGFTFKQYTDFDEAKFELEKDVNTYGGRNINTAVVVVPARSNAYFVKELNTDLAKFGHVVLVLTGDEENVFDIEKVKHPSIKIYVMSPREKLDTAKYRVLGTGYPPQMHDYLTNTEMSEKTINWFFAGQITHGRRVECAEQLRNMELEGSLLESEGFTQGLEPQAYYSGLARAKVAPCPSGPETPDTFRLFEALEAGCVPIADTVVSKGGFSSDYWRFFFGEWPPFPIIQDYSDLPGYIEDQVNQYPGKNNRVFAWWQSKKRDLAYQLQDDIISLSNMAPIVRNTNSITVVIPVSPIKSHPSTDILDETIASVRHHLPDSEIIVTFDGVRKENEDRRADYEEFIQRMLWKFNHQSKNILPVVFDKHMHQTGMAKAIMSHIKTPLLLYVEQDTPLVTDLPIHFSAIVSKILKGESNVVRLHHEGVIPIEHMHMIHGEEDMGSMKDNLIRTSQWSQRPHVASVAFYRRILNDHFSEDARSFIEDKMHGVVDQAFRQDGWLGWQQYRIHIYNPDYMETNKPRNIKRSYHTDGRAGEQKYDDTQVF